MQIGADAVKKLREMTGAGLMKCKKALTDADGDFEKAKELLRAQGLNSAAAKGDRATNEGAVILRRLDDKAVVMAELNSETDFVARNKEFVTLAGLVIDALANAQTSDINVLLASKSTNGKSVADEIQDGIALIGENIVLSKCAMVSVGAGVVAEYMHNVIADNLLCKMSAVVALESEAADTSKLREIGKKIAMHIVSSSPLAINRESLDPVLVTKEQRFVEEQAGASGKPAEIIAKMVTGRLQKFYKEVVLLEQPFIMDQDLSIAEFLQQEGAKLGTSIRIIDYRFFTLG